MSENLYNSKANPGGNGAPFFRIFYGKAEVFKFEFNQKNPEITTKADSFYYKYSEEGDDVCRFTLTTLDENLPDEVWLQEDSRLTVIWGYVGGLVSKVRTVYIRESKANYTPTGVKISIQACDKASYMRNGSSLNKKPIENKTTQDILRDLADSYGLMRPNFFFYEDGTISVEGIGGGGYAVASEYIKEDGKRDKLGDYTGNYIGTTTAVDKTAAPKEGYLRFYDRYVSGKKNDFKVAEELVNKEPGGPYVVEGRDDQLIVKKRNYNQKPIKTYRYKSDDELLEFTPETRNKAKSNQVINVNIDIPDRENKGVETYSATEVNDDNVRMSDILKVGRTNAVATYQSGFQATENGTLLGTGVTKGTRGGKGEEVGLNLVYGTNVTIIENPSDPENAQVFLQTATPFQTEAQAYLTESGNWATAVDNTSVPIQPVALMSAKDYLEIAQDVSDGEVNTQAPANNKRAKAAFDINPGTMKTIGDPRIESGYVVGIENVSRKNSGNYYIVESEHDLSPTLGYITTNQVKRNATGKTGFEGPMTATTADLKKPINKQTTKDKVSSIQYLKSMVVKDPTEPGIFKAPWAK